MNKLTYAEESQSLEKERIEKELIRLRKQQTEKRGWIKNKLKWLGKEPRAAFFYFFYLALYLEKFRGDGAVLEAEHHVNPFSEKAIRTESFNLTIDKKTSALQQEDRPIIGGEISTFDFNSHQDKPKSNALEMLKTPVISEKNSLLLSHLGKQEKYEIDLDKSLERFNLSTLKNKPANGVSFPSFAKKLQACKIFPGVS